MRRVIGARRGPTRSIRTESFSIATATNRSYGTLPRSCISMVSVTSVSSNALDKACPLSASATWATQKRWAATGLSSDASASEKSESTTAGDSEETTFIAALRHVIAELPQHGLRLVDLDERIRAVLGDSKKANPTRYGYSSIIDALTVVNETHYIADEMIMPCDWEKVITNVRNKLPSGGVLEPAFVRYINAEGCPNFRRGGGATSSAVNNTASSEGDAAQQQTDYAARGETPKQRAARAIRETLKAENPSGSSLPGVTLSDWVQTHFGRLVEVVDVTPHAVLARAVAQGVTNPVRTYMYRPIPEVHPYVNVLYSAFKCLGCPDPHHTPVAVPLTDIAAIVPLLPQNPKTSASYTWPEFLRVPEVAESFDTRVSVYVAEKKKAQTQIIFVDGTTLEPDEAEAAVHQWRARRKREVGADTQVNIHVVVVRREDDAPHTIHDVIVDGYVVEPAQAIVARLALISDTQSLDPTAYENIGGHGGVKNNNNLSGSSSSRNSENSAPSSSSSGKGWSAVSDDTNKADFSPSKPPSSSSDGVSKALSFIPNYEDEIEVSIAAQLGGSTSPNSHNETDSGSFLKSLADGERDKAAEGSAEADDIPPSLVTSSSSQTTALTSLSGNSLVNPVMPTANVSPDVVVLVGSRDAKETIDAEMAEVNAGRHWVRTMLVVGDV